MHDAPRLRTAAGECSGTTPGRMLDVAEEHAMKNHLAVVLGFCELLLSEMPGADPRRPDVEEIHRAATAAVAILAQDRRR